ncbi:MAG: prepilin-type N-terminal cleavage/methylation domain-containing protein [Candidatus Omnitrophica bacterium]|nr:prepilin-type N-terminal cleavage/methylation domain-containing protein [Candidatus Omnitrophota bacterium]
MNIRSREGGFSLLEVMLALLLFGVGFVSLLQILNTGLFVGAQNEYTVIAANLAQEKIEELRNATYATLSSLVQTPAVTVPGFAGFTREVLVGDLTPVQTGLKQITIKVNWSAKNSVMTTTMVTYVSNI